MRPEKVAIVHDRLEQNGGAERVLWALHEMFPQAPIFTAMWNRQAVARFKGCDIRTTWMQYLPGINNEPRVYAGFYPVAFRQLKLSDYDLVISNTSSFAQGVRTSRGVLHIAYCHSPANFVWRPEAYFAGSAMRAASAPLRAWLRVWDQSAAKKPDIYIATGQPVARRIRSFYGRKAFIIAPPIHPSWFTSHAKDEFFLVAGRLVPWKRVDLAIAASTRMHLPLVVAGTGRSAEGLQRMADGTTKFTGYIADHLELRSLYARAKAVLVPSEEDFGLVSLEAQAAGTPVIAFDGGGARETIVDGVTGILFKPQTVEGLMGAIRRFSDYSWDRDVIRANALRFNGNRFSSELLSLIDREMASRNGSAVSAVEERAAN